MGGAGVGQAERQLICTCIHPSIHPSINPINPSIHPSNQPIRSIHPSIHPCYAPVEDPVLVQEVQAPEELLHEALCFVCLYMSVCMHRARGSIHRFIHKKKTQTQPGIHSCTHTKTTPKRSSSSSSSSESDLDYLTDDVPWRPRSEWPAPAAGPRSPVGRRGSLGRGGRQAETKSPVRRRMVFDGGGGQRRDIDITY